jgi:hypothetical protein
MAKSWTINSNKPSKLEQYDWHFPDNDQEHVEHTSAPGDLLIKPEDISLIPTLAPEPSGIQSGQSDWTVQSGVDTKWYVFGQII